MRAPVGSAVAANRKWLLVLAVVVVGIAEPCLGQRVPLDSAKIADSSVVQSVRLRDGSVLVGRIVAVWADSVRIRAASGELTVARAAVLDVRQYPAAALRNGELWSETPHSTRLVFSPTAFPLDKGEGYYANFWLFLSSFAVGVSDRFTLGAGLTTVPTENFADNVFYLLPKYTVVSAERIKVALGVMAASVPWDDDERRSLGILYGVATTGSRESNFTLGMGWGYVGDNVSDRPVVTLGGVRRFSRRAALITENWLFPFEDEAGGLVSYGLRFLGERMSVDLAFANAFGGDSQQFFPGIPLVGFAIKF
jgi:hypothetical protein